MATVNKNFRIKDGLIVEGTTGTINGEDILTTASTTTSLDEGTNLYYTNERVDDRVANLVNGGTGISISYDDNGNALGISADFSEFTTDEVTEGTAQLYFTDERAQDATAAALANGTHTNISVSYDDNLNAISLTGAVTYTDADARAALSAGPGIEYNSTTGEIKADIAAMDGAITTDPTGGYLKVKTDGTTIDTSGSGNELRVLTGPTSTVASKTYADDAVSTHAADTSTHGVTGDIVGTTDIQTLTNKVLGASTSLSANLDADGNRVVNLALPVDATDAATKAYVDDVAQGLHVKEGVDAATTDTLAALSGGTVTYDNGTAGVGATLTLSVALTTLDGHTLTDGDRVLIKNEAEPAYNGIYVRTSSTVFTRDVLFDSDEEIEGGDFVFVVEGTENGSTGWVQSSTVNVVGTDDMVWIQFSGAGTYSAGVGLDLVGTEFSVDRATVDTWYDAAGSAAQALSDANDYADLNFVNVADLPGQLDDYVPLTQKGVALGVATLDASGYVPASQLNIAGDITAAIDALTTSDIEEGTNLYFTDARAVDAIEAVVPNITAVELNSIAKQVAFSVASAAGQVSVASFLKAEYRSAEFLVSVKTSTHTEISKVLLTLDASDNIAITEYGVVGTNGSLSSITASVSGTDVLLLVTISESATVSAVGTLLV